MIIDTYTHIYIKVGYALSSKMVLELGNYDIS